FSGGGSEAKRKFHPVMVPVGLVDLGLVHGVDVVEKDGRVVLNRESGDALMFLNPGTFGGHYADDPIRIARQFSHMVMALADGQSVQQPDWLPDDEDA
ncbi:hypothetical protein, partial [Methylobacterium dankookense]